MRFGILFLLILFSAMPAKAETIDVEIFKSAFFPAVVEVKKGDIVRWVNKEEVLHTVTSGKSLIHDEKFSANFLVKEFEIKIDGNTGLIDYFCAIHNATMRGVIVVVDKK